ncbi:MAG: M6 family metalloprotease domain-containing protein [Prevotella sp.]|nr:M6 family metalloprotease domain-containing protein [Prevotella sp.]
MKRFVGAFLMAVFALAASAVPAKRGIWKTVLLNSGEQIRVQLRGDEHLHYWQDEQGAVYDEDNQTGRFQKIQLAERMRQSAKRRTSVRRLQQARKVRHDAQQTGYYGKKKGLIILAQFTNKKFNTKHDKALYERIANERGFSDSRGFVGSVKDYFIDQSDGQFELDFDVVGPVTLSKTYSYYGENDKNGDDKHPGEMIEEACKLVKDMVDFRDYDWAGDGEVDQVFVVYAGQNESNGGAKNTIWPHMWSLSDAIGKSLSIDGVKIDTYACSSELGAGTEIDGIGAFCHEFSHCMGLPDFYDTSGSETPNFGMDTWSLMDYGCYNGDSFIPCAYTSYERMVCGWKQPTELSEETSVGNMGAIADGGDTYIMYNQGHPDEYYLLENRQLVGWDRESYGHGLLVIHVDYDDYVWEANEVNNDPAHQRCTVVHADNKDGVSVSDLAGDPFPYQKRDSLTNRSVPAAKLFNANTDGTKYLNYAIRDIKETDGTISFTFTTDTPVESGTTVITGDTFFYESFDNCAGKGGNDNKWSGSIASAKVSTDNSGWTSDNYYGAYKCLRVGSSKNFGVLTTPTVKLDADSEYQLSFKAAPWGSEENFMRLFAASGSNVTFTTSIFEEMKNEEWNEYVTDISGSGNVKIEFQSNKNRFFIDEVRITRKTNSETAIRDLRIGNRQPAAGKIYSLDGRYLGADFNSLRPGIYIIGGRKVVK